MLRSSLLGRRRSFLHLLHDITQLSPAMSTSAFNLGAGYRRPRIRSLGLGWLRRMRCCVSTCRSLLLLVLVLLRLTCILPRARSFDFRAPFFDDGLVFCVGGGVAAVERVVECTSEGFSCALGILLSFCLFSKKRLGRKREHTWMPAAAALRLAIVLCLGSSWPDR